MALQLSRKTFKDVREKQLTGKEPVTMGNTAAYAGKSPRHEKAGAFLLSCSKTG